MRPKAIPLCDMSNNALLRQLYDLTHQAFACALEALPEKTAMPRPGELRTMHNALRRCNGILRELKRRHGKDFATA